MSGVSSRVPPATRASLQTCAGKRIANWSSVRFRSQSSAMPKAGFRQGFVSCVIVGTDARHRRKDSHVSAATGGRVDAGRSGIRTRARAPAFDLTGVQGPEPLSAPTDDRPLPVAAGGGVADHPSYGSGEHCGSVAEFGDPKVIPRMPLTAAPPGSAPVLCADGGRGRVWGHFRALGGVMCGSRSRSDGVTAQSGEGNSGNRRGVLRSACPLVVTHDLRPARRLFRKNRSPGGAYPAKSGFSCLARWAA